MANHFNMYSTKMEGDKSLGMSNGTSAVFFTVLGLSGSRLAKSKKEKEIIIWLLEKDQEYVGRGTIGFDICDMPWRIDTFLEEKNFILNVIGKVKEKIGWETLNYNPNEDFVLPYIDIFYNMIDEFNPKYIDENNYKEWLEVSEEAEPLNQGFPVCEKHKMLLTCFGCYACNDEG
ncbi:hypothetical protein [Clostridium felsineum]|uniref:Uncharacterized protein n=1 Tax=Clostridium felsineum TaxID=36839 RepID=A0A1S8L3T1_9CLOT|nr:hypothetical protein [Clostridium felsineum]URZ07497.1 hypothetical protein CLROS_028350 [Clostridium felsineum]URZ12528.1 hypothetical protein CROST_032500 [Clostridium felsineum]